MSMGVHCGNPRGYLGDHDSYGRDRRMSSRANMGGGDSSPQANSNGGTQGSEDDQPKDGGGAKWLYHCAGWLRKGSPVQDDLARIIVVSFLHPHISTNTRMLLDKLFLSCSGESTEELQPSTMDDRWCIVEPEAPGAKQG